MADRLYNLRLTKKELWVLSENYAAAFTDPGSRDEIEIQVSGKLQDLFQKASRDPVSRSRESNG